MSMDDELEVPLDMMDHLVTNCSKLRTDIESATDKEQQEEIIRDYLKGLDTEPIDDFADDLDWFNVSEPLSLRRHLSGKVVVLDFFTYCCINCMHILPDLRRLEEKFPIEQGLVVVGVHSAKFENEKNSDNIDAAAQRYNIHHPVVNDQDFTMWRKLKICCWPTLLILGPRGNPLFILMGEGHAELLHVLIETAIRFFGDIIEKHPLPIRLSYAAITTKALKFPAKIAFSSDGRMYAVSDSGHNRILVLDSTNDRVLHQIGGKDAAFKDGNFVEARFNSPQGLCFYGPENGTLFVADTENHLIRRINLKEQLVATIIGTRKQGNDHAGGELMATSQDISSPWDVTVASFNGRDCLIIAMAGTHQIWGYPIGEEDIPGWRSKSWSSGRCVAIAGNGHEENRNNSYPDKAAFAQPSGLAVHVQRNEVYIADSESSTIRRINLGDGKVQGVVGGHPNPQNLFGFGDVDGKQTNAKLQHPLGVSYNSEDQMIYVADTYNHKIKKVNPMDATIQTMELRDRNGQLYRPNEPGGICIHNGILLVTNTNNHSIDKVHLGNLSVVEEIKVKFNGQSASSLRSEIITERVMVKEGGKWRVHIKLNLKDPIHFTDGAPQKGTLFMGESTTGVMTDFNQAGVVQFDCELPANVSIVRIQCKLSLCADDICFPKMFSISIPIEEGDVDKIDQTEFIIAVDRDRVELL